MLNVKKKMNDSLKSSTKYNELLNTDNTFFNSIDFDQFDTTNNTSRITKSQKFGALSLKRVSKPSPLKVAEGIAQSIDNRDKSSPCSKKFKQATELFHDTLDFLDDTRILLSKENKSISNSTQNLEQRSKSDGILYVKPSTSKPQEYDAFHNYLSDTDSDNSKSSQFSQLFKNSYIMNQIDNIISQETKVYQLNSNAAVNKNPTFKVPQAISSSAAENQLKRHLTDKLEDIFNETSRQELEDFFDHVEMSISNLDAIADDKNEKISQIIQLVCSQANQYTNLELEKIIVDNENQNINWSDESLLNVSRLSGINCSFATSLRKILLSNANKEVKLETPPANASFVQNKPEFQSLGPFYGLPQRVQELIKTHKGIDKLYDWQDECLKLAIENRKNLIYALPTSGGKTLVAEILMLREILCNKKNTLFILPFVAIVQEKVWALSSFGVDLDFLIEEYASSKGAYPPRKRRRKNSIYIATIEKALGLINSLIETERLNEIGLIVIDELHLVGEQGRGSTLEALLTKIMIIKSDIQIIGMSATIGNLKDICQFLNADVYTQNFRPVELTEFVKCEQDIAKVNWNEEEVLTVVRKPSFGYTEMQLSLDPDHIGGLVMEVIPKDSCLIFCPTKKNCENVAYLLCKVLSRNLTEHKKEEKLEMKAVLKKQTTNLCKILNVSLMYGIAYHHSGLTNDERVIIENAFRAGVISVICCTSTLAAGVNLPARRVIIRQPYVGRDFITLSKYKQMIGRAGRAGLGEAGDSITICASKDLDKVKTLLMSPMDKAMSHLHEAEGVGLRNLLLSCISLGIANTRAKLQEVSRKTLLDIQKGILDVNIKRLTDKIISELFKLGALEEGDLAKPEIDLQTADISVRIDSTLSNSVCEEIEQPPKKVKRKIIIKNDTKLVISKLGRAAIKGGFELTRAHLLYDDLHQAQKSLVLVDSLHLLYLITPYDLSDQIRPNKNDYYNIYCQLNEKEIQTARILGISECVALKMLSNKPIKEVSERVLHRFFLTLILYDLWNGVSVFEASEKFQVNRGTIENLMTASATFASNVVNFCEGLEEFWTFARLLSGMGQRISHCCIKELLPLMELPAVKQSRAKQLYNSGYKTLQSIAKANETALVEAIEYLSRKVAKQLIAAAKMLLLEKIENLREEAKDVYEGLENTI